MSLAPLKYKERFGDRVLRHEICIRDRRLPIKPMQGSEDTNVHGVEHAKLSQGNKAPSRHVKIQIREDEGTRQEDAGVEGDDSGVKDVLR